MNVKSADLHNISQFTDSEAYFLCTDEKCTYYSFLFTFLVDQILTNIVLKIIKCPSVLLPGTPGSNAPCLIWFNSCLTNAPVQSLNIWNNPGVPIEKCQCFTTITIKQTMSEVKGTCSVPLKPQ